MLMSRTSLGLELSSEGVSFALVSRGKSPKVDGGLSLPFPPGTLQLSRREPNVLHAAQFVSTLREAHLRLLTKERAVSLSLPDACGRVVILDLEARFRNREEGLDIIRWKLKKSFPFDISTVQLDYQTLAEKENGAVSLLVSLIARPVVTQFEELVAEAGLEARLIDFSSFNLYRLFEQRLEMSENGALVTYHRGSLAVMIFYGGQLSFFRTKETSGDPHNLYREVNSSLLVYRDRHPGQPVEEIFCMAAAGEAEAFRSVVAEATSLEPVLLDPERVVAFQAAGSLDRNTLQGLSASLGAALRSL